MGQPSFAALLWSATAATAKNSRWTPSPKPKSAASSAVNSTSSRLRRPATRASSRMAAGRKPSPRGTRAFSTSSAAAAGRWMPRPGPPPPPPCARERCTARDGPKLASSSACRASSSKAKRAPRASTRHQSGRVPAAADTQLLTPVQFSAKKRAPATEGARERACVHAQLRTGGDGQRVRELLPQQPR